MTDPIADLLARLRNGIRARKREVACPRSNIKLRIAEILKEEGYVSEVSFGDDGMQGTLSIRLKYSGDESAIEGLRRLSTPGQRRYARSDDIPKVHNGLGICIVSTSKGMMTDRAARRHGVGGELICTVW